MATRKRIAKAPTDNPEDIAPTTVETYKERIKAKFGLDTVIQCVAAAVAKGIVSV